MNLQQTIALLFVGGGAGGLASLVGLGFLASYARMKRSEPVDVRRLNAASGTVELAGTAAVHEGTDRSPFTDTETLVHRWAAEVHSKTPDGPNWPTLNSGDGAHPFLLEDGTGTVLVDPESATHQLGTDETIEVAGDESPPPDVAEFLASSDEVDADHDRKRRYRESRLDPGDDVHVLGPVRETGHSVDLPGGVDAVVGVENPDERGFTVGEDSLSDLVAQIRADTDRFVVSDTDEAATERRTLRTGVLWFGVGVLFLAATGGLLVVL